MKFPIVSIVSLFVLVSCLVVRAGVQEAWVLKYSAGRSTGTNQPISLAVDSQGNVIVAGSSTSDNGDYDYALLKIAPNGSLIWSNRYSSPNCGNDVAKSMVVDRMDSIIVSGSSHTVKFGQSGIIDWVAPYAPSALALDAADDIYLTGYAGAAFATAKLSASGTNMWERVYTYLNGPDGAQVICVDASTNVYVSGWVTCFDDRTVYRNRIIVSYDSRGGQRWAMTSVPMACTINILELKGIGVTQNGDVVVSGNIDGPSQTYATESYSAAGTYRWSYYLDAASFRILDGVRAMLVDSGNEVYLTGTTLGAGSGNTAYGTVKLNSTGGVTWVRKYGVSGRHAGNAVSLDIKKNIYVTGQSAATGSSMDWATVKYSSNGQELWVQRYDSPARRDDAATAISVTPDGSVYVAGWSQASSNLVELVVIKYIDLANITVETNRNVKLQFFGAPGQSNRVQATTNFAGWLDLGFSVGDPNGILHFLDTNAPAFPFRFYRTVAP